MFSYLFLWVEYRSWCRLEKIERNIEQIVVETLKHSDTFIENLITSTGSDGGFFSALSLFLLRRWRWCSIRVAIALFARFEHLLELGRILRIGEANGQNRNFDLKGNS